MGQGTLSPSAATHHPLKYENLHGGTRGKVGRWVQLQGVPAECRKTFKVHLSVFSGCDIKGFSRGQVRAGNSRVIKGLVRRRRLKKRPKAEESYLCWQKSSEMPILIENIPRCL